MNQFRHNCPHREDTPPRRCKTRGCQTWLSSRNEDDFCWSCGGWSTLRMRSETPLEAFQYYKPYSSIHDREAVGAALEEILA